MKTPDLSLTACLTIHSNDVLGRILTLVSHISTLAFLMRPASLIALNVDTKSQNLRTCFSVDVAGVKVDGGTRAYAAASQSTVP